MRAQLYRACLLGALFVIPLCSCKCTSSVVHDEEGQIKIAAWKKDRPSVRAMTGAFSTGFVPMSLRGVNEGSYEVLENGAGKFKVDIEGCGAASSNIESIRIDDVEMDPIDVGVDEKGARLYCPGPPRFGNIVLRVRKPNCNLNLMEEWWFDASQNKNETRRISISSFRLEGNMQVEVRRWDLDVVPLTYDPGDTLKPKADFPTETVTCEIKRMQMSSGGTKDGNNAPGATLTKAFTTIDTAVGGSEDGVWESLVGGGEHLREELEEACVEVDEEVTDEKNQTVLRKTTTLRSRPVRSHSIAQLELAGPVTDGRVELCAWVSAAAEVEDSGVDEIDGDIQRLETEVAALRLQRRTLRERRMKRDLRVSRTGSKEVSEFEGSVVTRYSFPKFLRAGMDSVTETVTLKPNSAARAA